MLTCFVWPVVCRMLERLKYQLVHLDRYEPTRQRKTLWTLSNRKEPSFLPAILRERKPVLFVLFALEQGIFENVAQCEHTFELAFLIDDDETVDARFANRIIDGGHLVIYRAGVYAREVLQPKLVLARNINAKGWICTSDRFSNASPTVKVRSSYTPPLMSVMTSTDSNTLMTDSVPH